MFVRFKFTKNNDRNSKPMYDGVILHDGKRYIFEDYCPSFSICDKNTHESMRRAMRQEIVEWFDNSPNLFHEVKK